MSVEPLPVDVPPAWHAAVYADNTFVSSESEHDLTLDLSQLVPGPDHRTVAVGVARVKMTPSFAGELLRMLSAQLDAHERRFEAEAE